MLQTMDGAAQVIDEKLIRMKELAEQAATGTYSDTQRSIMNDEFTAMRDEIERIAQATDFNGVKMLNATSGGTQEVLGVTEDATAFTSATAFISAFTDFVSGDTISVIYTDHNGNAGTSAFTVDSGLTITSAMASINAMAGLNVTAAWSAGTGLTLTDDSAGTSQMAVTFAEGGDSYTFSTETEGTGGQVKIHFGTGNDSAEDYYYANKQDMTASGLGIDSITIASQASAQAALTTIDTAILTKDTSRAHFGAMMNRLANTVTNLSIQAENIQAAESQVSDVDVALEMTAFVNNQIKAQAGVAMLAQANTLPQLALTLLGG
jgi:flagellin-like hook-associated protein FlgL